MLGTWLHHFPLWTSVSSFVKCRGWTRSSLSLLTSACPPHANYSKAWQVRLLGHLRPQGEGEGRGPVADCMTSERSGTRENRHSYPPAPPHREQRHVRARQRQEGQWPRDIYRPRKMEAALGWEPPAGPSTWPQLAASPSTKPGRELWAALTSIIPFNPHHNPARKVFYWYRSVY